jgi:hypothetical protein
VQAGITLADVAGVRNSLPAFHLREWEPWLEQPSSPTVHAPRVV